MSVNAHESDRLLMRKHEDSKEMSSKCHALMGYGCIQKEERGAQCIMGSLSLKQDN